MVIGFGASQRMPATQQTTVTGVRLKTPRAAAIAGILFSVLLIFALVLLRLSIPENPLERGILLETTADRVALALNLIPFAGIAFLWFIGVLRARLGEREDRFFATVFLGSGLLFLGMLFVAAAIAGAVLILREAQSAGSTESTTFTLAHALSFSIMHIYVVKLAGVFMITTSTIAIYTGIAARWIAYLGYVLAALLLFVTSLSDWTFLVFPLWVLLMSSYILVDNLHAAPGTE